ncbi:MAG: class B sortase [Dorea sp.]|jgi:sortase B|nr:class B sortase [Dorea sp.]
MRMTVNKYRVLQAALVLIFFISAGILSYQMAYLPMKNREAVERLKEDFPVGDTPSGKEPAGKERGVPSVDLAALREKYPDIQGWLTIPGTGIDYPVLQSGKSSPEYYLRRNYQGEWDINGSLFLQWNCKVPDGRNLIIYGHNMNSGAMFGNLDNYADAGYCREHPKIFFQTMEGIAEYEIVSVMKADIRMFPFQQAEFQDMEGLQDYLLQAKALRLFEMGKDEETEKAEQVLTLVTCSYEWKNARNVVVAVKKGMVE